MDIDYIIVEGDLERIRNFVTQLESSYDIRITKKPATCLTMIKAEDSLEHQSFYLGEALTTESEVAINGITGTGICLGDEPQRSYCMAVLDALAQIKDNHFPKVEKFLTDEYALILQKEKKEQHQILRSQVDFKLMEQA